MKNVPRFCRTSRRKDQSVADDVILNKVEIIENCLKRVDEIYQGSSDFLRNDQTKQDAILLNLERAC